ncbi:MAG: TIGR00282 family metallophosphoesterase [Candidatus Peregrinibacteria bacterium]
MKILFIGDIVGKGGRNTVGAVLGGILKKYKPDFVVANAENLTHGNGFSPEHIDKMMELGIHFFTSGNHVWENMKGAKKLDEKGYPVIRPENYPAGTPGRGWDIVNGVLVINLIGQAFMHSHYDNPFLAVDKILENVKGKKYAASFVDFHAETTSEEYAMGYYLDGRVSAVLGTHTHVPTKDFRVMDKGTAFISDVGMVGSLDSIIGVKRESVMQRFLTQRPAKHEPEDEGKMWFNAVIFEVNEKTGLSKSIEHIQKIL